MKVTKIFYVLVTLLFCTSAAYAGEIDILVQKLVDKGVLTAGEAQTIITETKEEVKKQIVKGEYSSLPMWLQTFKMKGDLRLRYEYAKRDGNNQSRITDNGHTIDRTRPRFRLRFGAETQVNNKVKVNFGLASGSDNLANSTNQTFTDDFAKKPVWIDYAYVDYTPFNWAKISGGRMKNPIWEPGNMLWDADINPEGGAINLSKDVNSKLNTYFNAADFVLAENAATSEPSMFVFQPGVKYAITDTIGLNTALAYYQFHNIQNGIQNQSNASNTYNGADYPNRGLKYGFSAIQPTAQIAIKEPLAAFNRMTGLGLDVPYLSFFGEYVKNPMAQMSSTGYQAGLIFGYEKVADWKQWQFKYDYAMLGTNSWPDFLPDSDRYGGKTGVRAHKYVFSFGLGKNTTLDTTVWHSRPTPKTLTSTDLDAGGSTKAHAAETVVMADLNFKF